MKNVIRRVIICLLVVALSVPAIGTAIPVTEAYAADSLQLKFNLAKKEKSVSWANAKKIHDALMKGKRVVIVFDAGVEDWRGSADTSEYALRMKRLVTEYNGYGVVYKCKKVDKSVSLPEYQRKWVTTVTISAANAKKYQTEIKEKNRSFRNKSCFG